MSRAGATLAVVLTLITTACGTDLRVTFSTSTLLVEADAPAAMVAMPDGGLLYGERLTGRIRRIGPAGTIDDRPVAEVEVSTEGQRGLLGLAVRNDREGNDPRSLEVFAAWTESGGRIVVGQVAPGRQRVVWEGPPSSALANGGHLAFTPAGRLVIGIGDLQDPSRIDDPDAPNGKFLALDPEGSADQTPQVLSSGWNNPFAFDITPSGAIWVADNVAGDGDERLTRADLRGPVTALPRQSAPSGVSAPSDTELFVCGYVSGSLLRYTVSGNRASLTGVVADDCQLGVVTLTDGRLAYATTSSIRVLAR